jgi:hypothetical protein
LHQNRFPGHSLYNNNDIIYIVSVVVQVVVAVIAPVAVAVDHYSIQDNHEAR